MRRTLIAAACLALLIAGCGKKEETPSGSGSPSGTGGCTPTVTGDAGKKPSIKIPNCAPPKTLQQTDLIVGTGKEAKGLGTMTFHYVGVSWTLKGEFDASWDKNAPFTYELARLIPGWQQGIPGMKEGGRRVLTIPPDLAYGPNPGSPKIAANDTLVFVIDLITA